MAAQKRKAMPQPRELRAGGGPWSFFAGGGGSSVSIADSAATPSQVIMPMQFTSSEANTTLAASSAVTCVFWVDRPTTINRLLINVAVQSGNIDLGIYDDDGAGGSPGTRLVSTGSFACPGVARQAITCSTTVLQPGRYWSALVADNITASFTYVPLVTLRPAMVTRYNKASSFPLPTSLAGASAEATANTFIITPLGI